MEPESPAADSDEAARLTRARDTVNAAAMQIITALGSILALAGTTAHTNQPLWRRLDVFSRADLAGVLDAEAQADIAHHLRPLVALQNRLANARWRVAASDDPAARAALTAHGGGSTTTTTIESIELLAEVFTTVAASIDSLDTRLTAQSVFSAPIPISLPAYIREIQTATARISTGPDAVWTWQSRPDPID